MADLKAVERVAQLSDEQLLVELGETLLGPETGYQRSGDLGDMQKRAEAWLSRNHKRLRELLCRPDVLAVTEGDDLIEIATVADCIADQLLKAPGALVASAIICRRGLRKLCS